jgi:hypothetical protein
MERHFQESQRFWVDEGTDIALHYHGAPLFYVPVAILSNTIGICRAIANIRMKTWANDEILADFIRTIHD